MRTRTHDRLTTVGAIAIVRLIATTAALASFTSATASVPMSVSSATLAAPTISTVAKGTSCTVVVGPGSLKITWTTTSSTWADGYEVFRSTTNGGPYSSIATVSGQSSTTYQDNTVSLSTTYYYVVQATKSNWRSVNSNQGSATSQNALCL